MIVSQHAIIVTIEEGGIPENTPPTCFLGVSPLFLLGLIIGYCAYPKHGSQ